MISFKLLEQYLGNSNITLVLTKNENIITVSLLPQPKIKDEAKSNLKPIMIKGTAEELDAQFHVAIQKPLDLVSGVIDNISEFEKSVEKLKAESKASEEAKKSEDKEKQENIKKGEKIVEKAKALFDKKEYDKATKLLNEPLLLTLSLESAIDLKSKIEALNPTQPDIFASANQSENTIEDKDEVENICEENSCINSEESFNIEDKLEVENNDNIEQVIPAIDFKETTESVTLSEIAKESPNIIIGSLKRDDVPVMEAPKSKEEVKPILNQEEIEALYEEKDDEPSMVPNKNFDNEIEDLF